LEKNVPYLNTDLTTDHDAPSVRGLFATSPVLVAYVVYMTCLTLSVLVSHG
jgi:hypothetical protein